MGIQMMKKNFLPEQYRQSGRHEINHCYLRQQFADYQDIFAKIEQLIINEDYTLGEEVDLFEKNFARATGSTYALGVGSGTDALFLSLKALDLPAAAEVITTPYTFFATVGAIATAGARPVFVDIGDDYNIDAERIEAAITPRTKAIMPVHWAGLPCDMEKILAIGQQYSLPIIADAAHAISAEIAGRPAGSFGATACFSMHPLKNLNVWGDGGVVVTSNKELYEKILLLRNHGLINRNECAIYGFNSRLDTLQAIVANHAMKKLEHLTTARIKNAALLDQLLRDIPAITIPPRCSEKKQVYHLYIVRAERRDELVRYLQSVSIDAKVHYPIPMHLQPAARYLNYRAGDFPRCEAIVSEVLSLPIHEFIDQGQLEFVADKIREFYHGR